MQLEYPLVNEDYVAFNLHVTRTRFPDTRKRANRISLVMVAVAVVVIVVVSAIQSGLGPAQSVAAVIVVLVFAGIVVVPIMLIMRRASPHVTDSMVQWNLRRAAKEHALGPVGVATITLDDDGVLHEVAGTITAVRWGAIERLDETPTHAFAFNSPTSALVIPRQHPGTAELIAAIRARVAAR